MTRFLYIQCDIVCPPQLLAKTLYERNIELHVIYGYYPTIFKTLNPLKYDGIIIGGGTMGSYQENEHPWLIPCKMFLHYAISHNVPVLGLCLGAQVLANVAGGEVFVAKRGGQHGFCQWDFLNSNSNNDPLINIIIKHNLQDCMVLSHNDSFSLPKKMVLHKNSGSSSSSSSSSNDSDSDCLDIELLAEAKIKKYPMIFRIGKYNYGFQAHPEADSWLHSFWASLDCGDDHDVNELIQESKKRHKQMEKGAKLVFDTWITMCLQNSKSKSKKLKSKL